MHAKLTHIKRQRGGQQGNQNARKHGFYSSTFTPDEINQFWNLINRGRIAPEMALLQIKLTSLVHQAPADRRVLKHVSRLIMKWYVKKYNLGRADRASLKVVVQRVLEQASGISLNNDQRLPETIEEIEKRIALE